MSSRTFASLLSATFLLGCATDPASDSGAGGGKADGETPVIDFDGDWNESKTGTLLAGSSVRINYDLDRLTDCRGSTNGSEVWGVTGYASFNGGEAKTFAVSRLDTNGDVQPVAAELAVPATATSVSFWFAINNRWGCIAYDSNDNRNYNYDVTRGAAGAVLAFNADFSESQSETIHAGDQVVVHYEPERLAQCEGSRNGYAAWSITAHWQVDGGAVKTLTVTRSSAGATLVPSDPTITVPRGRDLAVWFSATNVWGCNAYDSNMNSNYHFTIEQ